MWEAALSHRRDTDTSWESLTPAREVCQNAVARWGGVGGLAFPRVSPHARPDAGPLVLIVVHGVCAADTRPSRPAARRTHAARSCWVCAGMRVGR